VSEPSRPNDDFSPEASIPEGAVPLESILCTEELRRRPSRPRDYEKESRALEALASALAGSKPTIFQTLAETILDVTQCDSSGLSLLTKNDGGKRFYWPAIAGAWKPHVGGGTPRNFGPCGDVLDRNCTLLFRHFEQRYPYLLPVVPWAEECLLVPFYVDGKAVGTVWAITHSARRRFDAEDERIMKVLAQFASVAYQAVESVEDLRVQIAAREKAETALRERAAGLEAKIQRLIGANVMGIFSWNLEGAIVDANDAFLRMVDYSREELVSGRVHWRDLTPAEWRARDELAVADLKATGTVQTYQKEFFRKDGSRVPVLAGAALPGDSGNDGVAFTLDLSEQKRAEEAFRTMERQARSILDSALDALVAIDAEGNIKDWNKRAEEIFGWSRSDALGRRMAETIIPLHYRLSHENGMRQFFKTGQGPVLNRRIEITALRRDGTEFPVELTITPLKSGDTWTFSSFIRDISERKRAEEKLRESELNLRQMTETIPEMLWSASPDGAIDYCNARVLDYTGFPAGELMGDGWLKMIHPDDVDQVARAWMTSVTTGVPYRVEVRMFRAADRLHRWCVTSALPLLDRDGRVAKWHGTVVDMHDWKQAQEELRTTQAELAHVNRVMTMGELAASIAHEVNQPLAAIVASGDSCTAWLANDPPNLEKARAAASRITQAATQASEIVQRIRALFRKTTLTTAPLEINEVIAETISLVDHEVQRKGVSLNIELARDLPPVLGDRVQLQQVILNLLVNGTEAMAGVQNQSRRLVIQSALTEPREILVSIADTGPGFDPEQAARLFAPFFTTKPEGVGMGLSISRSIIEAHGGRLWAATNQPRGAVFHFALPATTANA
jgi:PAS domain S-box-containing protein